MPRCSRRSGKSAGRRSKLRTGQARSRNQPALVLILFFLGAAGVQAYYPALTDYYFAAGLIALGGYTYVRIRRWWTVRHRQRANVETSPDEFERICVRFLADKPKGLSPEQALSLQEAAARIYGNLRRATPAERQEIHSLLALRGCVRPDPENGIKLGKYRFTIDWEALIPISSQCKLFT
jgi:hypothetical protein